MTRREERFKSTLEQLVAEYIETNVENGLVTVSALTLSPDLKKATIYITVLPEDKEVEALASLSEKKGDLRRFLGEKLKTRFTPELEIILDPGRKTRELIDQLPWQG
jgi:ribosome-binding factor A